jgi:hypothetical protein
LWSGLSIRPLFSTPCATQPNATVWARLRAYVGDGFAVAKRDLERWLFRVHMHGNDRCPAKVRECWVFEAGQRRRLRSSRGRRRVCIVPLLILSGTNVPVELQWRRARGLNLVPRREASSQLAALRLGLFRAPHHGSFRVRQGNRNGPSLFSPDLTMRYSTDGEGL